MEFAVYALAAIGVLALVLVACVVIAGVMQPEEPRHIDPDLLIEMPRRAMIPEGYIPRRLRLSHGERTALAELLGLAISWNRVLRSPRIDEWKTALAKIDPACSERAPANAGASGPSLLMDGSPLNKRQG